ncbi:hypothetical protein OIV83_004153 [Microbotryomycetes sp. JL201]|nr:hypothetical protein OIV83_004153 [Microbotryomycetes sp. JL201]
MSSTNLNDLIPATSPLLLPSKHPDRQRRRRSSTTSSLSIVQRNDDIPDDLEFLAPGTWADDDADGRHRGRLGTNDPDDDQGYDDDSDDSLDDFTLEDGHIDGVPCCNVVLKAKQYRSEEFHQLLLELLRDDLCIPGWDKLPADLPTSLVHIHKVSGSLTNAVFFVSIPESAFEINPDGIAQPINDDRVAAAASTPLTPSSLLRTLELARNTSTPTPDGHSTNAAQKQNEPTRTVVDEGQTIKIEAPTLLLRVYGPSSGSLISRRTELHILHTLSSAYGIGPRVLGTFANGRVEEYFHSRALHKEEMRDPRVSRWIGRRMRELHRVDLDQVLLPDEETDSANRSRQGSEPPERPSLERMGKRQGSTASIYSTSSGSSIFSFGTSYSSYSTSSVGSVGSLSSFGTPLVNSPMLMPQRNPSESRAESKKRGRMSLPSRARRSRDKLGAWDNITRWTRQAKIVFKELDTLANEPGFNSLLEASKAAGRSSKGDEHVLPLASLSRTIELRSAFNLPLFEQQVKQYRSFVKEWERSEGKSKRVFSHNDTQYGNLLLLTPKDTVQEQELERNLQAAHQRIIVVDFEYASANPRGFDIANHFIEWQADYHHPTLSHALQGSYPDPIERARFLRAYVGCDQGLDTATDPVIDVRSGYQEDPRVVRLDQEVFVWTPASHAMWAVWGIVQAKEDLLNQVENWKDMCRKRAHGRSDIDDVSKGVQSIDIGRSNGSPKLTRTRSGDIVVHENSGQDLSTTPNGSTIATTMSDLVEREKDLDLFEQEPVVDFDYLSYALGRMQLFRRDAAKLGCL